MEYKNRVNNISIIMPAYNEAENIEKTVRRCFSSLGEQGLTGEVVVTDDGSHDDTLKKLRDLSMEFRLLKIVTHAKNEGYGAALRDAIKAAEGDYIITIDSDGQFDISEMDLFIREMGNGYDAVTGYRKGKKDSLFKIMANRGLNLLTKLFFGVRFKDTNCAFKLYNSAVLKNISIESRGYQAPTEVLLKLHILRFKIGEIGISHFYREKGKSALSPLKTIYKMFLFLFYLKMKIVLYRKKIISNI